MNKKLCHASTKQKTARLAIQVRDKICLSKKVYYHSDKGVNLSKGHNKPKYHTSINQIQIHEVATDRTAMRISQCHNYKLRFQYNYNN